MSVAYNWRRGAKANKPRPVARCAAKLPPKVISHVVEGISLMESNRRCERAANIGRFCSDHASRPAATTAKKANPWAR